MRKSNKYYTVWAGHMPGVYDSWSDCQHQIQGFPNAKYKSFKTLKEAEDAFVESFDQHYDNKSLSKNKPKSSFSSKANIIQDSISVDAACSGNPGLMEYRCVHTISKEQIFHQGPFEDGTNNIGEFLALVHALAMLKKLNKNTAIYTDSKTAMAWVRNKKVKTTLQKNKRNEIQFELIDRAIHWLQTNSYQNQILKWDTKNWGEIPADFGRK